MKGGVGKTQTTIALAEFLSMQHNKKILVIDLDPQTNATVALIKEEVWEKKNEKGETLLQLFKDKLDNKSKFNIKNAIVKQVSNIGKGIKNLDLLPSSLGLIEMQDSLSTIPAGDFYLSNPVTILKNAISPIMQEYDYILVDCPPNLGIITLNGLYISDFYLIPTIPDRLSTYGIPQIIGRVKDFAKQGDLKIKPIGIIISMYRKQSNTHKTITSMLKTKAQNDEYPPVYETVVPLTVKVADAVNSNSISNTLKQKYGGGKMFEIYDNLTNEFLERIK